MVDQEKRKGEGKADDRIGSEGSSAREDGTGQAPRDCSLLTPFPALSFFVLFIKPNPNTSRGYFLLSALFRTISVHTPGARMKAFYLSRVGFEEGEKKAGRDGGVYVDARGNECQVLSAPV